MSVILCQMVTWLINRKRQSIQQVLYVLFWRKYVSVWTKLDKVFLFWFSTMRKRYRRPTSSKKSTSKGWWSDVKCRLKWDIQDLPSGHLLWTFSSYTQWTSVGHIFHCFVQFSSTTPLIRTVCSSSLNCNFCQVFHPNRCYRLLIILFILQQTSVTTKLCQNVSHKLLPIIILLNCCQKFFCQTVVTNCCSHVKSGDVHQSVCSTRQCSHREFLRFADSGVVLPLHGVWSP